MRQAPERPPAKVAGTLRVPKDGRHTECAYYNTPGGKPSILPLTQRPTRTRSRTRDLRKAQAPDRWRGFARRRNGLGSLQKYDSAMQLELERWAKRPEERSRWR